MTPSRIAPHPVEKPRLRAGRQHREDSPSPMPDPRRARRDAEQAARAALGDTLIGIAGQLGEAHAHARNLTELIATARHKAEQIRAAANAQARELTDRAEAEAAEAARGYAAAWAAAKDADWAPNQLRSMGYSPPRSRTSRPRASTPPAEEVHLPRGGHRSVSPRVPYRAKQRCPVGDQPGDRNCGFLSLSLGGATVPSPARAARWCRPAVARGGR